MKLILISTVNLYLSLEAFALPTPDKAQIPSEEPILKAEDLAILEQGRPTVKRPNVQAQGWMLKLEKPSKLDEAKTEKGRKAL